jgi:hypothetical protein
MSKSTKEKALREKGFFNNFVKTSNNSNFKAKALPSKAPAPARRR